MSETTTQYRVYKLRLYPTRAQECILYQQATAQRFVWNWALATVNDHYEATGKRLRAMDLNKLFTQAKRERDDMRWLDKASPDNPDGVGISVPAVQMTFRNLDQAWSAFFQGIKAGRRVGRPRFKSKSSSRPSMSFPLGCYTRDNRVFIPKVGLVKYRGYDGLTLDKKGEATVTLNPAGQWHVSKLVKIEAEITPVAVDPTRMIGIDRGIRRLVTTSDGEIVENPKHLARMERKLKKLDRKLSRSQKGSNRREKAKRQRAKAYNHLANIRREYAHELTTTLVAENDAIAFGDRDIPTMIQRAKRGETKNDQVSRILQLPKRINDATWGEIKRQVEYKSVWAGKTVVVMPADFPATRMCSACGAINDAVSSLTHREWDCPVCGAHHDIDVNAAINIKREGARQLSLDTRK